MGKTRRIAQVCALALVALFTTAGESTAKDSAIGARANQCDVTLDVTFPKDTEFPADVRFSTGRNDLRPSDSIVIREVRGTGPTLGRGGIYQVRGEYTLASADRATLAFTVTAARPGEGCTNGNGRGHVEVRRGSGTFELASIIPYRGYPHVYFTVDGKAAGGVYFGSGEYLRK
jgi:hypothetical protein